MVAFLQTTYLYPWVTVRSFLISPVWHTCLDLGNLNPLPGTHSLPGCLCAHVQLSSVDLWDVFSGLVPACSCPAPAWVNCLFFCLTYSSLCLLPARSCLPEFFLSWNLSWGLSTCGIISWMFWTLCSWNRDCFNKIQSLAEFFSVVCVPHLGPASAHDPLLHSQLSCHLSKVPTTRSLCKGICWRPGSTLCSCYSVLVLRCWATTKMGSWWAQEKRSQVNQCHLVLTLISAWAASCSHAWWTLDPCCLSESVFWTIYTLGP